MSNWENPKLKELMQIDPSKMTDNDREDFFNELKNSKLLVPVKFTSPPKFDSSDLEKGEVITLDEPLSFEIIKFERNGFKVLPMFTDNNAVFQAGKLNTLLFPFNDIVDLAIEDGNIEEFVINPNSDCSIGFKAEEFILNFVTDYLKNSFTVEGDIEKYSTPFKEDTVLFLRSETPFMLDESEDGIFSADMPFGASTQDVCNIDFKYLNKLYIPEGTIFLYLANIIEDATKEHDIFLAPKLKFKLIKQDGTTLEWSCIEQDIE